MFKIFGAFKVKKKKKDNFEKVQLVLILNSYAFITTFYI